MKDIAFNPLGFSTQDVQQQVTAGELSSAEIALVFGDELGQAILRAKGGERLPEGGPCQGLTDSTQIVFWGIPQSGKTLAIASLLAEEGMQALRQWMLEIGLPLTISQLGATPDMIPGITKGTIIYPAGYLNLSPADITDILRESL